MKICLVHEEYPKETNFGGIATYQKILATNLVKKGNIVTVIARGNSDIDYYEEGVHVYRIMSSNDSNSIESVKEYRKKVSIILLKLQNNKEIDVIETPDWGANTIYFEKYRKIPLVVRLHTPLKVWLKYNNNNFGVAKDLLLKWEDTMLKKADLITSCSLLLKNVVLKEYNLKCNIDVIYNPYNEVNFYNLNGNSNNIIYVGSLEERKGVITFAKSLNLLLDKIPANKIYIVGKDTTRNCKNISTQEYMLNIINKKYHNRIKFVGQIDNDKINGYLNDAILAIVPSLFDNFPYTMLEEMLVGKHIICSDNIGSSELLIDKACIFKAGDENDLAFKVIDFYSKKKKYVNYDNINAVRFNCNPDFIIDLIQLSYKKAIKNYNYKFVMKNKAVEALNKVSCIGSIKSIKKFDNLSNDVYLINTDKGRFVVKKYNYKYDFDLCNKMYDVYKKSGLKVVKPLNDSLIKIDDDVYNIFNYISHKREFVSNEYLVNLINIDRHCNEKPNLIEKCDKYYNYLVKKKDYKIDEEKEILKLYKKISKKTIFYDAYLNHGDLSANNILVSNTDNYIIDFDETTVTTELYDFAVIMVKLKVKNYKFNKREMLSIISKIKKNYGMDDYLITIKLYLCKILLEKFYLYENNIIDLFDSVQLKDNYIKYIKLLRNIKFLEDK